MKKIVCALYMSVMLICQCGFGPQELAGGSTNTSNARVAGSLVNDDGTAARHALVRCIPADYIPGLSNDSLINYDYTDSSGVYIFNLLDSGEYVISAVDTVGLTRCLIPGTVVDHDTAIVPSGRLGIPGVIKVSIAGNTDLIKGIFYIPGTTIGTSLTKKTADGYVVLDSVPNGIIPAVNYVSTSDTQYRVVRTDIVISASDTTIINNTNCKFAKTIRLNTSSSGANVSAMVTGFPVLVRLTKNNFDFNDTKSDGSDLEFAKADNAQLLHEIERWDPASKHAEIWVTIDTVFGNDSSQSIMMYWGASTSLSSSTPSTPSTGSGTGTPESNGLSVFDTADGFQGVWHLGDVVGDTVKDATVNRYCGVSPDTVSPSVADGIIGNCCVFNGKTDYITMPNTSSSKLNFPQDGYFTLSAWAYADTFDNVYRTIAAKGYEQYFLQLSYFPGDKPLWQFSVFKESATWNMSHNSAVEKQWVLLTGVRQGTSQLLYRNGELIAQTSAVYAHPDTTILRNTTNDFSIGRFLKEAIYPTKFGYCYFKGMIDEVRVCGVARSPDWIKLCYMNQRSDDKLVQYK